MLAFAGLTDVTFVRANKLAFGTEAAAASITEATEASVGETTSRGVNSSVTSDLPSPPLALSSLYLYSESPVQTTSQSTTP